MAQFRFKMRAVDVDDTGYYHARWDRATPLDVIAETKQEAMVKGSALLGPTPHGRGWSWHFIVDEATEVEAPPTFVAPPLPNLNLRKDGQQ